VGMAEYLVNRVRMEWAGRGEDRHEHIEGVCTGGDVHYTRKDVADSLDASNTWKTYAGDGYATILKMSSCPSPRCSATPYLRTVASATAATNLENLPRC
jgi:hypothetical protein